MRYLTLSEPVQGSRFCRDKLNCNWVQEKHDFNSDVDSGVIVLPCFSRTNPRITFDTAGARRMNWASLVLLARTLSLKKGSLNTLFAPYFHLICPRPAKKKRYKYENENQIIKQYVKQIIILSSLGPEKKIHLPFSCKMTRRKH